MLPEPARGWRSGRIRVLAPFTPSRQPALHHGPARHTEPSMSDLRLADLGPTDEDPSAILFADAPAVRRLACALRALDGDGWTTQLADPPATDPTQLGRLTLSVTLSYALRSPTAFSTSAARRPTCIGSPTTLTFTSSTTTSMSRGCTHTSTRAGRRSPRGSPPTAPRSRSRAGCRRPTNPRRGFSPTEKREGGSR